MAPIQGCTSIPSKHGNWKTIYWPFLRLSEAGLWEAAGGHPMGLPTIEYRVSTPGVPLGRMGGLTETEICGLS